MTDENNENDNLNEIESEELKFQLGSLNISLNSPGSGKSFFFEQMIKTSKNLYNYFNITPKGTKGLYYFYGAGDPPTFVSELTKHFQYVLVEQQLFNTDRSRVEDKFSQFQANIVYLDDFFIPDERALRRLQELCLR
jgi:hypothetical protein